MSNSYPKPVAPYSVSRRAGNQLFVSGQLPLDATTGKFVEGDIVEHTRQCLRNVQAILAEQGLNLQNVVKTTVFVTDMKNFAAVNQAYSEFFTEPYSARSMVQVAGLPLNAEVEIEVIASFE